MKSFLLIPVINRKIQCLKLKSAKITWLWLIVISKTLSVLEFFFMFIFKIYLSK